MTGSFRLRIGIISVVIGGHFGGGDHFDGRDHFGGGTSTDARNVKSASNERNVRVAPGKEESDTSILTLIFKLEEQVRGRTYTHKNTYLTKTSST